MVRVCRVLLFVLSAAGQGEEMKQNVTVRVLRWAVKALGSQCERRRQAGKGFFVPTFFHPMPLRRTDSETPFTDSSGQTPYFLFV